MSETPKKECRHPFVWPDGDCVECGRLATTMPGKTEPTHIMVPRKFEPLANSLPLLREAEEALHEMLKANNQLMPGLAQIAVQDYQNINEAPIKAEAVLSRLRAAREGKS